MTFIDHKTSREAQATRRQKDGRGKRRKYETPDRPGTNLAYSLTGKAGGKRQTALEAALNDAGIVSEPRRAGKRTRRDRARQQPQKAAPAVSDEQRKEVAAVLRRMAGKSR